MASARKKISVMYGNNPEVMVPALLADFNLAEQIPERASIGIKPNLVVSKPSSSGATTDPRIVGAIIAYLQEHGFKRIAVLESAWVGDSTVRAFEVCGYTDIARQYHVPIIDLKDTPRRRIKRGGMVIDVCEPVMQVDYLINVPVLKAHCQTKMTCALKNLKGVIPDDEKQRFHTLGLHRPIAALSSIVKSDFVVVDGIVGDLTHEEGGNPVAMNRILAGDDPVLVDAYAAVLLGFQPADIGYIGLAEKLGVGSADLKKHTVRSLNRPTDAPSDITATGAAERFRDHMDAEAACSPCFGGLIQALTRLEKDGALPRGRTISIGQGFKEKTVALGIGNCTQKSDCYLKGCPPTAREIVEFLKSV